MSAALSFEAFRDDVGGELFNKMNIKIYDCQSWSDFREAMQIFNNSFAREGDYLFINAVKRYSYLASPAELALLQAATAAADFAWLADVISDGKTWQTLEKPNGRYRMAILACIAQLD